MASAAAGDSPGSRTGQLHGVGVGCFRTVSSFAFPGRRAWHSFLGAASVQTAPRLRSCANPRRRMYFFIYDYLLVRFAINSCELDGIESD